MNQHETILNKLGLTQYRFVWSARADVRGGSYLEANVCYACVVAQSAMAAPRLFGLALMFQVYSQAA
jgi:hypothetical protein